MNDDGLAVVEDLIEKIGALRARRLEELEK